MSQMTLEQLKAANADEPEAVEELTPELEIVEDEVAAEVAEVEVDEAGEPVETKTDDEPVEAWMQTEGETSEGEQKRGPSFKGLKQKLKGQIADRDDQIAKLEAKVEALGNGTAQASPAAATQLAPRPKREDFDFDDERYDAAVDEWNDVRQDARADARSKQTQTTQATETALSAISKSVSQHYGNAATLVSEGKVTEDAYMAADQAVREAIEAVMPGKGDAVSDFLISRLNNAGEGSEKVWFHLGRNPEALLTLKTKMAEDPMGIDAAMYLGHLRNKITATPVKRVSQAPAPGSKLKGDAKQSTSVNALEKKYKAADGDPQQRINIKRAAREAGIDTKLWS